MILYVFLALSALAERLVVIESDDLLQTANELYREQSMILSWAEVRRYPLLFSNVSVLGECSVYPKKLSDVEAALEKVTTALDYMELEKADGHLLRVEGNLRCLNEPVSPELLSKIYFISGLTHFYREEQEKTIEQWKQAYSFNEGLSWDDQFEPSGKPLFQETLSDLKLTAQSSLVVWPSQAKVTVDGKLQGTSAELHSGKHLIQHGTELRSYLVEVEEAQDFHVISFQDFPAEISVVMSDKQGYAELSKALKLGTEYSHYVVLTKDNQWTMIPNTSEWKSISLKEAQKSMTATLPEGGKKRRLYLAYASAGTATMSALSFFLAGQKYNAFLTSVDDAEQMRSQNHTYFFGGVGLGVVSGGLMIAGVTKW